MSAYRWLSGMQMLTTNRHIPQRVDIYVARQKPCGYSIYDFLLRIAALEAHGG